MKLQMDEVLRRPAPTGCDGAGVYSPQAETIRFLVRNNSY